MRETENTLYFQFFSHSLLIDETLVENFNHFFCKTVRKKADTFCRKEICRKIEARLAAYAIAIETKK